VLLNNGYMLFAADKHFKAFEDTLISATDAADKHFKAYGVTLTTGLNQQCPALFPLLLRAGTAKQQPRVL
jgi:hypothetical protein